MSDEYTVCEGCGQRVEPESHEVMRAVELTRVQTFRGSDTLEGLAVLFHEGCFPRGSSDYRLKDQS